MEAVFAPTRFSLVRISVRDLVSNGKSSGRNSGVGGGGQTLILIEACSLRSSLNVPARSVIAVRTVGVDAVLGKDKEVPARHGQASVLLGLHEFKSCATSAQSPRNSEK